jgi:hypothetical protein
LPCDFFEPVDRAILRWEVRSFGVKTQDLEDGVAEVQTRTLEYLRGKELPTETERSLPNGPSRLRNATFSYSPTFRAQHGRRPRRWGTNLAVGGEDHCGARRG